MRPTFIRLAALLLSGLSVAIHPTPWAAAQTSPIVRAAINPYAAYIAEASQRFGIPAAWIRAVMRVESRGNSRAVSRAGAIGLMQVMPATWAELRVRHRLGGDPYDPRDNILAGAAYLRELHDRYGSATAMLAAYNAGPGRYEASLAGRPLPAETRAYIAALAPAIDGEPAVAPVRIAATDPLAWTRSSLFIVWSGSAPAADPTPIGRPSSDAPAAIAVRDISAAASQPDGLFVARAAPRPAS